MTDKRAHDPDTLLSAMIDISNRLDGTPNTGQLQSLVMISASGFSIAAAIRDLAAAIREKDCKRG